MFIDPTLPSQVHADTPNIGTALDPLGFAAEPGSARAGRLRLPPLGQTAAMPLSAQAGQPRASQAVRTDTSWGNASSNSGYNARYNHGYDARYDPGYEMSQTAGHEQAYTAHYEHGSNTGYEPGYDTGYQPAYDPGYEPGYEPGYDPGYEPAYTAGYEDGYTASYEPGPNAGYEPGDDPGHNPARHPDYEPSYDPAYRTGVGAAHGPGYDPRSEFALAHPSISRPAMGPAELTSTALVVYEQVRSHYRGRAKSGNKIRVSTDPANQRAHADYERWRQASDLLVPLHASRAPIQHLIEAGVGNCDDMASHAALLARQAGLKATLWGMWDAQGNAGYHCFCVVSAPGETASPFDGGAQRGSVHLVIDPWSGVIDRVENYGLRMNEKMHKWAREGKQIHCSNLGGWIVATDHRWLDVVAVPRPFPIAF